MTEVREPPASRNPRKVDPWVFWRETLGSPKHVMAPMVDGSDLAYRLLSRRYGTHLTYTPMIHTRQFNSSKAHRKHALVFDPKDRPCMMQFGGTGVDDFLPAAKIAQHYDIVSIDLNFGCPQRCARSGGYGCFLMLNNPGEAFRSVRALTEELEIPVTCKIRIFPEKEKTIEFAKGLEENGCVVLAVHCRTKDQKGQRSGSPDWDIIRDIKAAVDIPVIANGGLQTFEDIDLCLDYTKCDAVMSADAMLWNPAFFSNKVIDPCDLVLEYLEIFKIYPGKTRKTLNGHVYEILRHRFDAFPEFRQRFVKTSFRAPLDDLKEMFLELKDKAVAKGLTHPIPTTLPAGITHGTPERILREKGLLPIEPLATSEHEEVDTEPLGFPDLIVLEPNDGTATSKMEKIVKRELTGQDEGDGPLMKKLKKEINPV